MTDQQEHQQEQETAIPAQATPPAPGPWAEEGLADSSSMARARASVTSGAGGVEAALSR